MRGWPIRWRHSARRFNRLLRCTHAARPTSCSTLQIDSLATGDQSESSRTLARRFVPPPRPIPKHNRACSRQRPMSRSSAPTPSRRKTSSASARGSIWTPGSRRSCGRFWMRSARNCASSCERHRRPARGQLGADKGPGSAAAETNAGQSVNRNDRRAVAEVRLVAARATGATARDGLCPTR
jgi:hypothetical protein